MSTILDRLFRKNQTQPDNGPVNLASTGNYQYDEPTVKNLNIHGNVTNPEPYVTPGFADAFPGAQSEPAETVSREEHDRLKGLYNNQCRTIQRYQRAQARLLAESTARYLEVMRLNRALRRAKAQLTSLRYATKTEYADARRTSFEAGVNHATDVLLRKGIIRSTPKLVQPGNDHVRAFLREAFKQGKRLQVWHVDRGAQVSEGVWEDLTAPLLDDAGVPVLGCPPHLYRVHPDDAAGFEANLPG